jgi:hypothetical protein
METILIRIYLIEARFFRKACHREAGMVPILSDLALGFGCGAFRCRGILPQFIFDLGRIGDQFLTQFLHPVGALVLFVGAGTLRLGKLGTVRRRFHKDIERFLQTCFSRTHTTHQ